MNIVRAAIYAFRLPLRRPLSTAHGTISERNGWLVELEDARGLRGFGESTPLPDFGTENLSASFRALEQGLSDAWEEAADLREFDVDASGTPCARFALEEARADLAARLEGRSLAEEIRVRAGRRRPAQPAVAVQALIGGLTPEEVEENGREGFRRGYRAFKLKLSVSPTRRDWARDVERVSALRSAVGPGPRLRLDANEAWSREEAMPALTALEPFGIDFVEQPVARDDLTGLAELTRGAPVRVAADEALLGSGLAACLAAHAAEILVVKPAAIGGIAKSIDLWKRAAEEGLHVIWSSLIDGRVGRAGALALASALGKEDEVHGLGTADLLLRDLSPSVDCESLDEAGRIPIADRIGIGFDPPLSNTLSAEETAVSGPALFEIRR